MRTQQLDAMDLLQQIEKSPGAKVKLTGKTDRAPWSGQACIYWEYVVGQPHGESFSAVLESRYGHDTLGLTYEDGTADFSVNAVRFHLLPTFDKTFSTPAEVKLGRMPADIPAEDYPLRVAEYQLAEGATLYAHVESLTVTLPPATPGGEPVEAEKKILHLSETPMEEGQFGQAMTPRSDSLSF